MLKRVIPVLLLSGKQLVKTREFQNPTYVGDPLNAVKLFSEKEADELIVLDIDASREARDPHFDLIQAMAEEAHMPFSYGGGITSLAQIEKILRQGTEKIVFNTAAHKNPTLIKQAVQEFGASTISLCINVKKGLLGRYSIYDYLKKGRKKKDFQTQLQEIVSWGCGEHIIQSVERDGTSKGYDTHLIKTVRPFFTTPVVALGGAKDLSDMKDVLRSGADAVAAGSLFVFYGKYRAVLITYPSYEERKRLTI